MVHVGLFQEAEVGILDQHKILQVNVNPVLHQQQLVSFSI